MRWTSVVDAFGSTTSKNLLFFLTSEKAISEQRGLSTHGETIIKHSNGEQRVNLDKEDEQSEN